MSEYPSFQLQSDYFRKKSGFHHTNDVTAPGVAAFQHLLCCPDEEDLSHVHWAFEAFRKNLICNKVSESNEACKCMLEAFRHFFEEYQPVTSRAPSRDLEDKLEQVQDYFKSANILSLGMETALQFLKLKISRLSPYMELAEIRNTMCEHIDTFINEKIDLPSDLIANIGSKIISNGDVILIYDYSVTVLKTLMNAKKAGTSFRVVLVDSRASLDGKKSLAELVRHKIHCTYILISNVSYHMPEVTRVIIGADGVYNNCCLLNKVGTAMICCIANAFKKPVLVCAEIYKLSEKVQLDSFCFNVLGSEKELTNTAMYEGDTRVPPLLGNFASPKLLVLNLKYDVTPPKFIDMLITEVGAIPVSSVPVVLREFRTEAEGF
jgi:translation initiation factor eIF-2B subunit delta